MINIQFGIWAMLSLSKFQRGSQLEQSRALEHAHWSNPNPNHNPLAERLKYNKVE